MRHPFAVLGLAFISGCSKPEAPNLSRLQSGDRVVIVPETTQEPAKIQAIGGGKFSEGTPGRMWPYLPGGDEGSVIRDDAAGGTERAVQIEVTKTKVSAFGSDLTGVRGEVARGDLRPRAKQQE